jgi:beta-glucosidase
LIGAFGGTPQIDTTFGSIAINGTIIMGGGSGATTPAYVSSPLAALTDRAMKDGSALFWDVESPAPGAPASDACLVFINAWASEGYDRPGVYDDYSDNLVLSVADQCNNTIVVIHNAGVRLVDNFADHPNVTAIVYAHTPGQDSGAATVSLLYGDENFSGKMPYSVPKNISDYGALLDPSLPGGDYINYPQSNFSEGIFIDYRDFESRNVTPRYEFGFGLSYTSFEYGSLSVTKTKKGNNAAKYPSGAIEHGGQVDLWDVLARVKFTVKNTGRVSGKEATQLYIDTPSGVKQLRGFEKVSLDVGERDSVTLPLTRRDLSEWDVVAQKWRLVSGKVGIYVGASLKDVRLQGTLYL